MSAAWFAIDRRQPCTLIDIWQRVFDVALLQAMPTRDKNRLTRVTVGYLLRIYTWRDMTRIGADLNIPVEQWRELRHTMLRDSRTVLGIKMLLVRCYTKKLLGRNLRILREIKQAGLVDNDAALVRYLPDMQLDKLLEVRLQELPVEQIPTVPQVMRECEAFLRDQKIKDWVGKFVHRKMAFIYTSQNYEAADIIAELMLKATETFFFITPFQTELHRRNYVKRAIHHYGINMMKDYNTNNPRLWYNGHDWVNLVQTFSTYNENNQAVEQLTTANVNLGLHNFTITEHRLAVAKYLQQCSKTEKQIMELLSMTDDNNFTKFLQQRTGDANSDNETSLNKYGLAWYFTAVADYLRVPMSVVTDAVQYMQALLFN